MKWEASLYLENGHYFEGLGFGAPGTYGGELVFNTGLSGYQEIFTDPSYSNQIVVMGSAHIGNTGMNLEDIESSSLALSGVVVREYCSRPSSWRLKETLDKYLEKANIPLISDVDTREITQILRDEGAQRGVLFNREEAKGKDVLTYAKTLIEKVPSMEGLELVSELSCKAPYEFKEGKEETNSGTVVVYDFGVKTNILRSFRKRRFKVQVVPHSMPFKEVLSFNPKAVCLSNGPGDPSKVGDAVKEIQSLVGKMPVLAICMGHQLLARALGGETYKLKFGHHGTNHPVKDLNTNRILITSQNHGFAVKAESLPQTDVRISHINLNDQTVEGFCSEKMKFYSVQFHPESKPGPSDSDYIFDYFLKGFLQ